MNNKEFTSEIARRMGLSTKDATKLINSLNDEISQHLENEDLISIQGFGTFEVKKKLEHVVVNPSTRQKMLVPPKMEIKYKPSAILKDKIN